MDEDIRYCELPNEKVMIIVSDKDKYKNLANQVNGKWDSRKKGWVVTSEDVIIFKKLVNIVFSRKKEKEEEEPKKHKPKRNYRRAKSPDVSDSSEDEMEKHKNEELLRKSDDELSLDSSSDDENYNSDSSDDYPVTSPSRKKLASDDTLNKISYARKRMKDLNVKKK